MLESRYKDMGQEGKNARCIGVVKGYPDAAYESGGSIRIEQLTPFLISYNFSQ